MRDNVIIIFVVLAIIMVLGVVGHSDFCTENPLHQQCNRVVEANR